MKILKATLVSLIVSGIVFASYGCSSSAGATPTVQPQITQVQRGNISISVIGTGNLAFSKSEKLAFDMAGIVEEVLVSEGDTVEAGAELVRLDIDNWEDQLKSLDRALTSARRALVNKENDLNTALRQVSVKEMAVTQAEINLQTAEYNLGQIKEVKRAQDSVDAARLTLDIAVTSRKINRESIDTEYIKELQAELEQAQANLQKVLARTDTRLSTTAALEIAQKVLAVEQNKKGLEEAQAAVETARTAAEYAELDVQDARQDLKDAQEKLAEAQSLSPVIKAPFAGYITRVNVSGGDEVLKGTVAVQIADPHKIEAQILVSETDIFSIALGKDASVSVDALSGLSFPAKITRIAPTATISQGVVNYSVVVELTSLTPDLQAVGSMIPASSSEQSLPAFASAGTAFPPGASPEQSQPEKNLPGAPDSDTVGASTVSLKEGLSATVNIPIQQKENVLLIPSRAIVRQGQTATVQVMEGTTAVTRAIKTGLRDGSMIEVIEGLNEGDKIMVRAAATTTQNFGPGGMPPF